jgi:hypothetical protein
MTEETATWLVSQSSQDLLTDAADLWTQRIALPVALSRLRKRTSAEQASAVWKLTELRSRARAKFGPEAARLFFTPEALEQASSASAAAYHTRRFAEAGLSSVADVCGGIGGDSLAFARAGLRVTLCERDPVRAIFAAANVKALGLEDRIQVHRDDALAREWTEDAIWFDPARRGERGRAADPEDYSPPLSLMRRWNDKSVGVKIAPAIDHGLAACYDADLEFLSDHGECKEALLWTGALRQGVPLQATLLRDGTMYAFSPDWDETVPVASPDAGRFLYEPDAAVIRAHAVGTLAKRLRANLAAPQIAYLIGEEWVLTPFATGYEITERFSYSLRRLQKALTQSQAGHVVIKKRGFPQEPEELRRHLTLRGSETMIVILTRAAAGPGHQAILCRPGAEGRGE